MSNLGSPFLAAWSNIIRKALMRTANFEQFVNGFKESNRVRISGIIQANNTAVVQYIAPYNANLESLIVASPSGATTSSSGNSVTFTVIDKNGSITLATFDTYSNAQELAVNTGVGFFTNTPLAVSNGTSPSYQIKAGDVITLTAQVNGTPGITSSNSIDFVLTFSVADHNFAY